MKETFINICTQTTCESRSQVSIINNNAANIGFDLSLIFSSDVERVNKQLINSTYFDINCF